MGNAHWLSQYLQSLCAWPRRSIALDISHHYGFLHRLDTSCSGLILTAKTYEAYYHLKFQLSVGTLVRDYVVLCHGCIPPGPERRDQRQGLPLECGGQLGEDHLSEEQALKDVFEGPCAPGTSAAKLQFGSHTHWHWQATPDPGACNTYRASRRLRWQIHRSTGVPYRSRMVY